VSVPAPIRTKDGVVVFRPGNKTVVAIQHSERGASKTFASVEDARAWLAQRAAADRERVS
jgi:hypothetical protein